MLRRTNHLFPCRSDCSSIDERRVGGKAWNLFRLRNRGYEVPSWCVVSAKVFEKTLKPHAGAIGKTVASIDFTDQAALEKSVARIGELVLHSRFPHWFSEELDEMLDAEFPGETHLSVRSSAVGEDSADHSFAGQMDSFLNVPRDRIPETIKKVWASAFSARALIYRKHKGMGLTDVFTAVIVQQMVETAAAGVLFSREPETGGRTCVISAGYGLGEGIVSNIVASDTYKIDWDAREVSRDVAVKDHRVVPNRSREGGTRLDRVSADMRTNDVLTAVQLVQLQQIAVRAEADFGAPQDIEWAFDNNGRLFVLQARPIVFTRHAASLPEARIWDNSNIVESYPGLTLPLTFSFARSAYASTFRNAALSFLLFRGAVKKRLQLFENLIGLLDGRVYYNLLNWYEMLSYLPGSKQHRKSWDRMVGVAREIDPPPRRLTAINYLYAVFKASWKLLTLRRGAKKFFAAFDRIYGSVEDQDFSALTASELVEIYEAFTGGLEQHWPLTLDNDFGAMTYYHLLGKLCDRWGLGGYPNIHNDLLCGEPGLESVAPVRSIVRVAEMFGSDRAYRDLMSQDDSSVWREIENNPAYVPLKTALATHLKSFGDRTLEELKLDRPSLRQEPEVLIGLVRSTLRAGLSVEEMEQRERQVRASAETFVRQNLRNPLKRVCFGVVLRNARTAISSRENMRFARSRVFGVVKRMFQRMGEMFVARGFLDAPADLHYLTVEEVLGFVHGTAVTQDLRALVEIRKAEYLAFADRTPAERVETVGFPYGGCREESYLPEQGANFARGIGCSSGLAKGEARVVLDPHDSLEMEQRILVAKSTDPAWVFLMVSARGIVVERGSVLSHTAIIGRELGIPTIVGVRDATKLIPDGAELAINGGTGEAWWQ